MASLIKCYKVCRMTGRYEKTFVDAMEKSNSKDCICLPCTNNTMVANHTYAGNSMIVQPSWTKKPCATANSQCREMKQQALINANWCIGRSISQKLIQ